MKSAIAVVATALLVVPGAAQAQPHHPAPRLKVLTGLVQGKGDNKVGGSFVVANAGTKRSRGTVARLAVKVSSRRWTAFKAYRIPALSPRGRRTVTVRAATLPRHPKGRSLALRVCLGTPCWAVGSTRLAPRSGAPAAAAPPRPAAPVTPTTTPVPPAAPPAPAPGGPPVRPADTTPPHPIAVAPGDDVYETAAGTDYWLFVPRAYDPSHRTPSELFVWLHGCYGDAKGDLDTYENDAQSYIMISLGGTDGGCWDVERDPARAMAAIADVEDKLNIDRRRVVIGGYSSGGDVSYRTAFYNAYTFSGVLAVNTLPFRDTGSTFEQSLAAAAWRFNIAHLAHTADEAYPIDQVHDEFARLRGAGWNPTLIERPGTHHDANTETDVQTSLLPYLEAGWQAP